MDEVLRWNREVDQGLECEFPFLRYATTNWVSHAEIVEAERISQGDLLGLFQWPSNRFLQSWTDLYDILDRFSQGRPAAKTTLCM